MTTPNPERMTTIHETLANSHAKLRRGTVWCHTCKREQKVNAAECFWTGWPQCCGSTMSIDAPSDRLAVACIRSVDQSSRGGER